MEAGGTVGVEDGTALAGAGGGGRSLFLDFPVRDVFWESSLGKACLRVAWNQMKKKEGGARWS